MSKELKTVSPDFKWNEKIDGAGPGGMITSAGNSHLFKTGDWRSMKPIWKEDACKQCLLCHPVCPDSSILVDSETGKMTGIDYEHCKGCGICVKQCKFNAIDLVEEGK